MRALDERTSTGRRSVCVTVARSPRAVTSSTVLRPLSPGTNAETRMRSLKTYHVRHENGGGYAAVGSWAFDGRPAGLFTTTGPGITNAITSLETARASGAKLVLLTPLTPVGNRGRGAIQDTSHRGYRNADVHAEGRLFDLVELLESPAELPGLAGRLATGLASPGPFMAHIAFPAALQLDTSGPARVVVPAPRRPAPGIAPAFADEIVDLLAAGPFAVWVGWGARGHAAAIRRFLDLTGAPVMSSLAGWASRTSTASSSARPATAGTGPRSTRSSATARSTRSCSGAGSVRPRRAGWTSSSPPRPSSTST